MAGKRKKSKSGAVAPDYFRKQQEALRRIHRKTVLFNDRELAVIDEYCRRFKVSSRSALIRQATMERVMKTLDENHPTLF
ncbi:MAG: hypothetical protein MJY51_01500 [Bacteroidales bacterium]|nr:hypothetical protein [Bacteroidales bacterium]